MDQTMLAPVAAQPKGGDRLRSTAQVLALPEGLYLISIRPNGKPREVVKGVSFPCVQLSSIPQPGTTPLEFLAKGILSPVAWLHGTEQVVVTILSGSSPLLVTNHLLGSEVQSCLDLDIKLLSVPTAAATVGLRVTAFIQAVGEQQAAAGEWLAAEDAPFWIESVRIDTSSNVGQLLQYRVPGTNTADSGWTPAPGMLGTPGGRPLSGIAFRLMPPLSNTHRVIYAARFLRYGEMEGKDGEPCRSPQAQDPLIALRVAIIPK